jgi:translation initiation factor IF-3
MSETNTDSQAKLGMTLKWLQKLYEVRIVIAGDGGDAKKTEHVAETLEKSTAELGRVVQKRNKEGTIRFQILPIAKKPDDQKLLDPSDPVDVGKATTKSIHTDSS